MRHGGANGLALHAAAFQTGGYPFRAGGATRMYGNNGFTPSEIFENFERMTISEVKRQERPHDGYSHVKEGKYYYLSIRTQLGLSIRTQLGQPVA